jgi:hypothetical protein
MLGANQPKRQTADGQPESSAALSHCPQPVASIVAGSKTSQAISTVRRQNWKWVVHASIAARGVGVGVGVDVDVGVDVGQGVDVEWGDSKCW